MPLSISYSVGKGCSLPEGGCVITLRPNSESRGLSNSENSFVSSDRYLLTNGDAQITYNNSGPQIISSPYSGKEWQSYIDMWTYNIPVQIAVTPSTEFLQINADNCVIGNCMMATIDNSGVDIQTTPNSKILVIGSNFSVDNIGYTEQKTRMFAYSNTQTVNVRSLDICKVVYIEEA